MIDSIAPAPIVHVLPALSDNYMYLVQNGQEAFVIDPASPAPVTDALSISGCRLMAILNTHHHFDHVSGNLELKRAAGCQVYGPNDSRIPGLDHPLRGGESITVAGVTVEILATPGHGASDLSFYLPPANHSGMVWTGDALFCAGCGRVLEGTPEQLWGSLQRLSRLPDETLVYCGHEYTIENLNFALSVDPNHPPTRARLAAVKRQLAKGEASVPSTLAVEKDTNPFLRAGQAVIRQAVGLPDGDEIAVFTALRERKNRFG